MDEATVIQTINETFAGVHAVDAWGDLFFYYNPDRTQPDEFYFASLKSKDDDYDHFSNLDRPNIFRLNIGISKASYQTLFGTQTPRPGTADASDADYDFTVLDQLVPHPVYGKMYWVSVLNPSDATFEAVKPLLAEAYELVVDKSAKRADHAWN